MKTCVAVMAVAAVVSGCPPVSIAGRQAPVIDETTTATWHQQIAPLFARACIGCHRAGAIAPIELDTYAKAKQYGAAALDAVQARRMPPFPIDGSGQCQQYADVDFLSNEEVSQLAAWVRDGFPEGPVAAAPATPAPVVFEQPTSLKMAEPYTPRGTDTHPNDDYRCFLMPGVAEERFLTGTHVLPGSPRVVHHVLLYSLGSAADETKAQTRDEADEGSGWSCFGGVGDGIDYTPIVLWAPGMPASRFPADTGIKLVPNRRFVMEVHYNLANGVEADQSTVVLDTRAEVTNEAVFLTLDDGRLKLPPGLAQTQHRIELAMSDLSSVPLMVHSVGGHMHTLGKKMRLDIDSTCLMTIPQWDFNWQRIATLKRPLTFTPTQRIRQVCEFDTTSRKATTSWGEGTEDEMCLSILYVTAPGSPRL